MSREYMNKKWCVRCGKETATPFLKRCLGKYMVNSDDVVVDIGCGNGRNSDYVKFNYGCQVYSFDMKPDYGMKMVLGKDNFPLIDKKVDIVLANYVFMFLNKKERKQVLGEIKRILNCYGLLIWELYPAKDSYCKTDRQLRMVNREIEKTAREVGFNKVFLTKDKGFFAGTDDLLLI